MPSREEIKAALIAYGLTPADTSGYNSEHGHYYAARVFAGGREDGEIVFAGHGFQPESMDDTITIPEGTYLSFYVPEGQGIHDASGVAVECGVYPSNGYTQTFGPGDTVLNYQLRSPRNLSIMSNSHTVAEATPLSELLQSGMGNVHWAACRLWRR